MLPSVRYNDNMLPNRQHVVNDAEAGAAFTDFVMRVFPLNHRLTAAGEAIAREGGQTLARWLVLETIDAQPASVADIARRLGQARQGVQRLADALAEGGAAAYEVNPRHRRAQLLRISSSGRQALERIRAVQQDWAAGLQGMLDRAQLDDACAFLDRVLDLVTRQQDGPGGANDVTRTGATH